MEATERKIIEQLLETIKEKDATIRELKDEVIRFKISLPVTQPSIWENPYRWAAPYIITTGSGYTYSGEGAKITFEHKNENK